MADNWQTQRIEELERELRNTATVVAILTQRLVGDDGIARITTFDIEEARRLTLHKTSPVDGVGSIAYWVTRKGEDNG